MTRNSVKHSVAETNNPPSARRTTLTKDLKIREASFDDYSKISDLHIRNGLITRSYEDWIALWRCNPAYKQLQGQWPIGWVLETDHGNIVGSIGSIPLVYHFKNRELRAAASCSWVVDPPYRGYSLLIFDQLMKYKGTDCFVCTSVSPASEKNLPFFKWSKVPVGAWNKTAFWITNYYGFVNAIFASNSVPLAGAISYPVSAALLCRDKFKDFRLPSNLSAPEVEPCLKFDSRFDEFWEELKYQNPDLFLAVRTRETLSWHFRHSPPRQGALILTASKGSQMVAYAVFDRNDNVSSGLKRVRFVDFQALKGSEQAVSSALCWVLRHCREKGIHILEDTSCRLERLNSSNMPTPFHRKLASWTYYYKANNNELCEKLKDPAVWAPTLFDGDASL
jgi:hypothetical protein